MAIDTHDDEAAARALLAAAEADTSPVIRKMRREKVKNLVELASLVLITPIIAGLSFTHLRQSSDWWTVILVALALADLLLFALTIRSLAQPQTRRQDFQSFAIRRAAQIGDEQVAPVATAQSLPLKEDVGIIKL